MTKARAVTVLIHHRTSDSAALHAAYEAVSARLDGVPGMLGNELWAASGDSGRFVVASRWSDLDAFTTWEATTEHRADTEALRPYRDLTVPKPFEIFQTSAAYGEFATDEMDRGLDGQ